MAKGLDSLFDCQGFDLIAVPQDSEICVLPMASGASSTVGILISMLKPVFQDIRWRLCPLGFWIIWVGPSLLQSLQRQEEKI
jgi:hypothetical protein